MAALLKPDDWQCERRSATARLLIPPCGQCQRPTVRVVVRTEYVLYLRCSSCGHVWNVPNPVAQPLGTARVR